MLLSHLIQVKAHVYITSQNIEHHNYRHLPCIATCGEIQLLNSSSNSYAFPLLWHENHNNFWHFTFDIAFRLFYLKAFLPASVFTKLMLVVVGQESLQPYQENMLEAIFGSKPQVRFAREIVCCHHSIFIAPTESVIHRKEWLLRFSLSLKTIFSVDHLSCQSIYCQDRLHITSPGLKYYIERGAGRNPRFLRNESDLQRLLARYGFQSINPGSMSLADQAEIFGRSDCLIGVHGSAFVNMLFMQPRSTVIELISPAYDAFHDYILAQSLDIRYLRLCCRKGSSAESQHAPFFADLHMVERCLSVLRINTL